MDITIDPKPVLDPDALYLGDGGCCLCGLHAGAAATYTGRDLSGQPVYRLTAADLTEYPELTCEGCNHEEAAR